MSYGNFLLSFIFQVRLDSAKLTKYTSKFQVCQIDTQVFNKNYTCRKKEIQTEW